MNSLLFFCSINLFLLLFFLVKKSDKKLSIIKWIHISLIIIFCINSILAYILSYIRIPTNLYTLSILFFILSCILYYFFVRNKETQKYYFDKSELTASLIILLFTLVIAYLRFGFPFSISYVTFDPGVHFESAKGFYEGSFLFNIDQTSTLLNYETWRFASYTNVGILFKFLSFIIPETQFYSLYILYDVFTFYITGVLFYYLLNNKKFIFLKLIGTFLFLLGYPLNNLFIGFFYVGHATNIIICIILYIRECEDVKLLPILNLGLIFTYYLFIPFVFLAEFIYLAKYKIQKEVGWNFVKLFVIPIILWIIYFIVPTFKNTDMNLAYQITLDGLFFNDVIGNFLLLLPMIGMYICFNFKKDKYNIEINMFIVLFIMMIYCNIIILCDIIKPYYISKYYYILWVLSCLLFFRSIGYFYEKYKPFIINYLIFIVIVIIWGMTGIENKIIDVNTEYYNKTNATNLFSVYSYNMDAYMTSNTVFYPDEAKDILKLGKIDSFYTNGSADQILWTLIFSNAEQIDCPVNNAYNCILSIYSLKIEKFFEQEEVDTYIYVDRNYFWKVSYVPDEHKKIFDNINRKYYDVFEYDFGFVIKKK